MTIEEGFSDFNRMKYCKNQSFSTVSSRQSLINKDEMIDIGEMELTK
jgi:hypothetical protein